MKQKEYMFLLIGAMFLPVFDLIFGLGLTDSLRPVLIFSLLGLGLNVLTGYTGILHLGVSAFMAIGAYSYAILSCEVYPFQLGFWGSILGALVGGGLWGLLLGLPTMRLRGDYLAIVTLGFGEIMQDLLRNLEVITKGTQGINPLPSPSVFGYVLTSQNSFAWYYFVLFFVVLTALFSLNLENSRVGRSWMAVREDELAARCMGVKVVKVKLLAFILAASICSLAGALWVSFLGTSGEPGNYDFQVSIMALCMVIVGGMGSVRGVLLGSLLVVGFNSIVLVRLSDLLTSYGYVNVGSVYSSPNNWKYMIFGFALILMMRFRPEGLLPSAPLKAELHQMEEV